MCENFLYGFKHPDSNRRSGLAATAGERTATYSCRPSRTDTMWSRASRNGCASTPGCETQPHSQIVVQRPSGSLGVVVNSWPGSITFTAPSIVRPYAERDVTVRPESTPLPRLLRSLGNEARFALDGPRPSPELAPARPDPSYWSHHRLCHLRAIPSTTSPVRHGQPRTVPSL
jgi:hypothetical protein